MSKPPARQLQDFSFASRDALLLTLLIAVVVHVLILVNIKFDVPKPAKLNPSVSVSFAPARVEKAPAGELNAKPAPLPAVDKPAKAVVARAASPLAAALKKPEPVKSVTAKPPISHNKTLAPPPVKAAEPEPASAVAAVAPPRPALSMDSLMQQVATIGEEERNRTIQQNSQSSKMKFANAVKSHKFLAEQYVNDWEAKVERTGNLNYPEAARKQGQSLLLTMDVGINADGSIYSLRVVKSSGNPALDEAAKRIVKMSAPFAELPVELLQEVNVLVITRVWKFSDETGMTAR